MSDTSRFVLINPSHPANVGAVARAMKVMGFHDLVLVDPRYADVLFHEEAMAMASGATDVLAQATVVADLTAALEGIQIACATAMTPRDFGPPTYAPRDFLPRTAMQGGRVAFVFGCERYGMANEDVYRCHAVLSIPTSPGYGSLNLAQAVQLMAYEWRQALGGFHIGAREKASVSRASVDAVQAMLTHLREALVHVGFLNPQVPKKLMPRLTQMFNRAGVTAEEVHIWRGISRAMMATQPDRHSVDKTQQEADSLDAP